MESAVLRAESVARSVREDADAGLFDGKKGDPGNSTISVVDDSLMISDGTTDYKLLNSNLLNNLSQDLSNTHTNPLEIVVIGDSNVEGWGSTTLDDRWINRLQAFSNRRFGSPRGAQYPFIPTFYNHTVPGQPVTSENVTQGTTSFGFGWRASIINNDTGFVKFTFTGTSASIVLTNGVSAGVASVSVNGSEPYLIDTYTTSNPPFPKTYP